ncbi:AAA family ATPase [Paenarthrobacter nicotinovorans]|uniref:AAA family ATPase n=1 Tax=Paenarthrobacter nicotinovorans TaxID=29320 RepID=UPI001C92D1ED|nr:AAA family ATPase [Paenarthrobacter nicotinovorans]
MRRVVRVRVEKLFGYVDHDTVIRTSTPTILTAPNGAGKTHLLMLLRAALGPDVRSLLSIPFSRFQVDFSDGRGLNIERFQDDKASISLLFESLTTGKNGGDKAIFTEDDLPDVQRELPAYIKQLGNDRWYDARMDRTVSSEFIEKRFGVQLSDQNSERFRHTPEILELFMPNKPILIDTKRLDAAVPAGLSVANSERLSETGSFAGATRINEYTNQIRNEVTDARRNSIRETQRADLSFAGRAIAAAHQEVDEDALHVRYDMIVDRYENLARNALAVGQAPMEFPKKTTSTVRTILNVFLDDWERRLDPLLPLNDKIRLLREILDTKLYNSGKKTSMSPQGGLMFTTFAKRRVRVSSLSSGEQHLVALFTLLLFSAKPGSLVLIDEPEISLHAGWKHAFLDDISRVAQLADLQIILATHSTSIINGQWSLTEELRFPSTRDELSTVDEERTTEDEMDDLLE